MILITLHKYLYARLCCLWSLARLQPQERRSIAWAMQFTAYLFNLCFMVSPQLQWHARYRRNDRGTFIMSTCALVYCNFVLEMGTEIDRDVKSIAVDFYYACLL